MIDIISDESNKALDAGRTDDYVSPPIYNARDLTQGEGMLHGGLLPAAVRQVFMKSMDGTMPDAMQWPETTPGQLAKLAHDDCLLGGTAFTSLLAAVGSVPAWFAWMNSHRPQDLSASPGALSKQVGLVRNILNLDLQGVCTVPSLNAFWRVRRNVPPYPTPLQLPQGVTGVRVGPTFRDIGDLANDQDRMQRIMQQFASNLKTQIPWMQDELDEQGDAYPIGGEWGQHLQGHHTFKDMKAKMTMGRAASHAIGPGKEGLKNQKGLVLKSWERDNPFTPQGPFLSLEMHTQTKVTHTLGENTKDSSQRFGKMLRDCSAHMVKEGKAEYCGEFLMKACVQGPKLPKEGPPKPIEEPKPKPPSSPPGGKAGPKPPNHPPPNAEAAKKAKATPPQHRMSLALELPSGFPHTATRPQGNLEVTKPYVGRFLQGITCCGLGQADSMKTPSRRSKGNWEVGVPWQKGVPIPTVTLGDQVCVVLCFQRLSKEVATKGSASSSSSTD
jgi:hypothetical protein